MSRQAPSPRAGRVGRLAALWTCLALVACAPWQTSSPVTPVSYQTSREQMPRTVGKLRRLAVLQVRQVPKVCAGGTDAGVQLEPLDAQARDLLAQRKGYELVDVDAAHPLAGVGDPLGAASVALVADLMPAMDPAHPPGLALNAWLGRLRHDERVDGVLVLRLAFSCHLAEPTMRILGALMTFGVSELARSEFAEPSGEYVDAVVFETASARVVWRHAYGRLEQELVPPPLSMRSGPGRIAAFHAWAVDRVIGPIEPAVPRLLTR